MKTFDYFLDQKVATWYRTRFKIEASNQEEADEKAKEFILLDKHRGISWDEIEGVQELLRPEDNGLQPTEELFQSNGEDEIIWSNFKNQ